jgi:ring-1,2-phenylacetyl-CoA epoxidase subunit PaaC
MPLDTSSSLYLDYVIHLADDALIQGHRNSEWTGFGPVLEQDIAMSNIALDLVGQARNFYQYAASLSNQGRNSSRNGKDSLDGTAEVSEDTLAYLRDSWDFKNVLLTEQPNGDWAKSILKEFFFSASQFYLYEALQESRDRQIAAIAEKALKEVRYHLVWSGEWVIRLGDGTSESHRRIKGALEELWKFTGELFLPVAYEAEAERLAIGPDLTRLRPQWHLKVSSVLKEATLPVPEDGWMHLGGKQGTHTEHLGYLLAEMQFLQRAYPNSVW